MKFSALNVGFGSASFDRPLFFQESFVRRHQIWVFLQNARFRLLSTYLAAERLHVDTDLLLIIRSTADKISGGTNIDDLKPQK